MPRIDVIISNDRHHVAIFRPIVQRLADDHGYRCRILSLCGLRGLPTPEAAFEGRRVSVVRLFPSGLRPSPSTGRQRRTRRSRVARTLMREAVWRLTLRRRVAAQLRRPPALALVANDAAFPYDRITGLLNARGLPFVLFQEGIRFPLPGDDGVRYGTGGAAAIAAWGRSGEDYFRGQGVDPERIHRVGSPRFDRIDPTAWRRAAEDLRGRLDLGTRTLLLLSNPIDDQGFCSTEEKLDMVRRLVRGAAALFDDPGFRLVVKLHARESVDRFREVLGPLPFSDRVRVVRDASLYALFPLADAAVTLASTAGLEAMIFGVPLGVVEIPRFGFVHDYVASGAARGITWSRPIAPQLRALLDPSPDGGERAAEYLRENLGTNADATDRAVRLVTGIVEPRRPRVVR